MSKNENMQHLLSVPVASVLAFYGKRADHRRYMYYSPFRDESEPSMKVTEFQDGTWVWHDYGTGENGGVLDMVCKLEGNESHRNAYEVLSKISGRPVEMPAMQVYGKRAPKKGSETGIVVVSVSERFTNASLLSYFTNVRFIPTEVLDRYCVQVKYYAKSAPQVRHFAAGFHNNSGGFALRGTGRVKINSAWALSTLSPNGCFIREEDACFEKGDLFEGFVNFLSKITYRYQAGLGLEPGMDSCVLHSASNVAKCHDWVLRHRQIRTFFDNDEAGDKATEMVKGWCKESGIDFKDGRCAYLGYNDINEALVARNTELRRKSLKGMSPS